MNGKTYPPIKIAYAGKFTSASGDAVAFSETDLADLVGSYDPTVFDAPIVLGHPKHNDPAYGWVGALSFDEAGRPQAHPSSIVPDGEELIAKRAFKKVSMSLYTPGAPSNPKPGHWYLRHVGLFGAAPVAMKGLPAYELAEHEEGVVELSEYDDLTVAGLFRRLRDWIIGKDGTDAADKVLPNWEIESLTQSARQEIAQEQPQADLVPAPYPSFSDPLPTGDPTVTDKTAEFAEREAAIAAREAKLAEREAEAARQAADLKATKEAAHRRELADFAEELIRAGKVLPRDKDGLVEFAAALDDGKTLEFGEGAERKAVGSLAWLEDFLKRLPKQVEFSELSYDRDSRDVVNLSADEREVCAQMGISEDEFRKTKGAA